MKNQIYCGDSAQILAEFPVECVDLVVTDPPYLGKYKDRTGRTLANDDNPEAVLRVFDHVYRVLKPHSYCISFYGWTAIAGFAAAWDRAGFQPVGHIVWPKRYASRQSHTCYQHESAYLLAKGFPEKPVDPISDVQRWDYTGNREHPTQKAISVISPLIKSFSRPGDTVLDPFLGSGTTAVAAAMHGRSYVGIELEAAHCETARKRMARFRGAGRLPRAA